MGYPIIGENCYIGAGAKIIGDCKIGANVRIGANAVVYKDVPDNCVVTGAEMKIVKKENMDNRYFSFDSTKGWAYKFNGDWHRDIELDVLSRLNKLRKLGVESE
jgi:serine O-acetyltransferase